jgi:hypothetical protein
VAVSRPSRLYSINEVAAFGLELVVLGVLSAWGVSVGHGVAGSILIGIAAPALAAAVWGLFAAPRARFVLPPAAIVAVKAAVFAVAVAALAVLGYPEWAAVLAVVLAANTTVAVVLKPKEPVEE